MWWADYRLADDVWRDFLDRQERERFEAYRREADRLRAALAELEVTPAHEVPRVEAWPLRRDLVGRIQIHDLDPDDSHRASVAVIGAPPLPVIRHLWRPPGMCSQRSCGADLHRLVEARVGHPRGTRRQTDPIGQLREQRRLACDTTPTPSVVVVGVHCGGHRLVDTCPRLYRQRRRTSARLPGSGRRSAGRLAPPRPRPSVWLLEGR